MQLPDPLAPEGPPFFAIRSAPDLRVPGAGGAAADPAATASGGGFAAVVRRPGRRGWGARRVAAGAHRRALGPIESPLPTERFDACDNR